MQRILVVEDNDTILKIFTRILEQAGFQADQASSAEDGIKAISSNSYNVALIDMRLRDDSFGGFRVAEAADRTKTWLVAISGSYLGHEEEELTSRFDEVVEKPISNGELVSVVQRFATRRHV